MEEQVFLDFQIRFSLRHSKTNKPSIIYAVVQFNKRKYKINTDVRIYPQHWIASKQIAMCGSGLTKLDIYNNSIVNNKLRYILLREEEMKMYLCEHLESTKNFYSILKQYINPNMKEKAKKTSHHATHTLRLMITKKTIKESSKTTLNDQLKTFERFLKEKNIPNTLDKLNLTTLEQYQQWLIDKKTISVATVQLYCFNIISLSKKISKYSEYDFNFHAQGLDNFEKIEKKISKNQKKTKQVTLTEDELIHLYKFDNLLPAQKEARDIFILQCLIGQRITDTLDLLLNKIKYEIGIENGIEVIKFIQQKNDETAIVPLFPIAKEILLRYKDGLIHINTKQSRLDNYLNKVIKIITDKAGLNRIVNYTEETVSGVSRVSKHLHELIHTHTARHTFITLMCRLGIPKENLIIMTGHTDTTMIDDVYLHQSDEDRTNLITKDVKNVKGSMFNMGTVTQEPDTVSQPIVTPTTNITPAFDYSEVKADIIKQVQQEEENKKLLTEIEKIKKREEENNRWREVRHDMKEQRQALYDKGWTDKDIEDRNDKVYREWKSKQKG